MALALGVARLVPPQRPHWRSPRRSRTVRASASFPVFEKLVGTWDDNVRYVNGDLTESNVFFGTQGTFLTGTRTISIENDVVTLESCTTFPNGKTLNLSFKGKRVEEAFGLKDVVRFDRVVLDVEEKKPIGYYPIVLLAAEHPKPVDNDSETRNKNSTFDVVIVREVMVETGKTVLAETITLLDFGDAGVEAAHASQEIGVDGELGGVQLWRSTRR